MYFYSILLGVLIGTCSVLAISFILRKKGKQIPLVIGYLLGALPFLTGGFYTFLATLTAGILLIGLLEGVCRTQSLKITVNMNALACLAVIIGYCITPLWAADKGMAVFGILRCLPVLLFAIWLMQYSNEQKICFSHRFLSLVQS